MLRYYVALFDIDFRQRKYDRGDILSALPGGGPASGAWASFEPIEGLLGKPKLTGVDDPGSGNLTFHYTIGAHGKGQTGFFIKSRIGIPLAYAEREEPWSVKDGPPPVKAIEKPPKLEYGAGLAASAGRSFVGFVSKSRVKKTPVREATIYDDPLHFDDGYDPLHRGED